MLSNWQKRKWKLNFQYDNVIVLKENLVFNMQYHVKLLVLGIKSTVEMSVTKPALLQGAGMIRNIPRTRHSVVCATSHAYFDFVLFIQNRVCKNV